MLHKTLKHLERLVGCDTMNPPRKIGASSPIIEYIAEVLLRASFELSIDDLGDGCVNLLATRGQPTILFNNHLDTVPASEQWTQSPHALQVKDNRAVGLGACDIKGAAAALLTALESATNAPAAVLFTTDEEAGTSRCVRSFIEQEAHPPFEAVLVAEPTECQAVLAHRGLVSAQIVFRGTGAHASQTGSTQSSAVHRVVQWSTDAIKLMNEFRIANGIDSNDDMRFNLGRIEGGTKANVVASSAIVVFGFRPRLNDDIEGIIGALQQRTALRSTDTWRTRFQGPALCESCEARKFANSFNIPLGAPVDFWTEAALFAEVGFPAIVFGPGHIAQAHAVDEWVALDQLQEAANAYKRTIIAAARNQPQQHTKDCQNARLL